MAGVFVLPSVPSRAWGKQLKLTKLPASLLGAHGERRSDDAGAGASSAPGPPIASAAADAAGAWETPLHSAGVSTHLSYGTLDLCAILYARRGLTPVVADVVVRAHRQPCWRHRTGTCALSWKVCRSRDPASAHIAPGRCAWQVQPTHRHRHPHGRLLRLHRRQGYQAAVPAASQPPRRGWRLPRLVDACNWWNERQYHQAMLRALLRSHAGTTGSQPPRPVRQRGVTQCHCSHAKSRCLLSRAAAAAVPTLLCTGETVPL